MKKAPPPGHGTPYREEDSGSEAAYFRPLSSSEQRTEILESPRSLSLGPMEPSKPSRENRSKASSSYSSPRVSPRSIAKSWNGRSGEYSLSPTAVTTPPNKRHSESHNAAAKQLEPAPLSPVRGTSSRRNIGYSSQVPSSGVGAGGNFAPPTAAQRMMHQFDAKRRGQSTTATTCSQRTITDDDRELALQKLPSSRRRINQGQTTTASSAAASSSSSSSPYLERSPAARGSSRRGRYDHDGGDEEDLIAQKMPRSRPALFDPTTTSRANQNDSRRKVDPPAPLFQNERADSARNQKKEKQRAVATAEAAIMEESRLTWSPSTQQQKHTTKPKSSPASAKGGVPSSVGMGLPVAAMAEPSSVGNMGEPATAAELSQSNVLPVGKDTVSSYNALDPAMSSLPEDAPTRAAEASVISYCTVPSVDGLASYIVEASPVDPRFGVTRQPVVHKASQFDKGYSAGFQRRQNQQRIHQQRIEQQKLQLEQDLLKREKKNKAMGIGGGEMKRTNPPPKRLTGIQEMGESQMSAVTVKHRNTGRPSSSSVPRQGAQSSIQSDLPNFPEEDLPPPKEATCCVIL